MFNKKKKENQKIREQYEYIKKAMIQAMVADENGNELVDAQKYNQMFTIEYDKNGEPKKISKPNKDIVNNANSNGFIASNNYEVWGRETYGGIVTESGEFIPYVNVDLKPIEKTKYQGYSNIYDNSPFISDDYK